MILAIPAARAALEKIMKAAEEVDRFANVHAVFTERMTAQGFPTSHISTSVSPYDLVADYFRGATGTTPYYPADVVTLRTRWQDGEATFMGFKAGEMGASHGNLDAGSFVLDALGTRWAVDLGGDDYALPGYFGSQRWTYYRLRAEGHNTLVINPGMAVAGWGPNHNETLLRDAG